MKRMLPLLLIWIFAATVRGQESGQPLASNVSRVLQSLEFLGQPLSDLPVR